MRRLVKMTDKASNALKDMNARPTQFLVDGDSKTGYELFSVDNDLLGYNIVKDGNKIKSYYAVKRVIEDINTNGIPINFQSVLDMRCFSWAIYSF